MAEKLQRHRLINPNSIRIGAEEFSEMESKIAGVHIESGEKYVLPWGPVCKTAHVWYPDEVESTRKEINATVSRILKKQGYNVDISFKFEENSRFEDVPDDEMDNIPITAFKYA